LLYWWPVESSSKLPICWGWRSRNSFSFHYTVWSCCSSLLDAQKRSCFWFIVVFVWNEKWIWLTRLFQIKIKGVCLMTCSKDSWMSMNHREEDRKRLGLNACFLFVRESLAHLSWFFYFHLCLKSKHILFFFIPNGYRVLQE
jgi:hypothetical protein